MQLIYFFVHRMFMKRIVITILSFLTTTLVFSQIKQGPKIQWEDENWSWGKVVMELGTVIHTYNFINVGDEPVRITEASPSCGCTVAEWTLEPVMPGKSGYVKVKFDPKGKLGHNSKYVTVKSNANSTITNLTLSGDVISNSWQKNKYKLQYGNIAVITNNVQIGNIKENSSYSFEIPLANTGKKPINIKRVLSAPNIVVTQSDNVIKPDEEIVLYCVYTPIKPTIYGENTHEIRVYSNDDTLAIKSFMISSIVAQDFSKLTKKQLKKSPIIVLNKIEEQFGTISDEDTKTTIFKIFNKGKSNLILHKIISQSESLEVSSDKMIVKKGDFASITVKYSPRKYIGVDERFINVISNDPKNSNFSLSIKSYVLPAE